MVQPPSSARRNSPGRGSDFSKAFSKLSEDQSPRGIPIPGPSLFPRARASTVHGQPASGHCLIILVNERERRHGHSKSDCIRGHTFFFMMAFDSGSFAALPGQWGWLFAAHTAVALLTPVLVF